jgi:CHASE3 domain sensor protein
VTTVTPAPAAAPATTVDPNRGAVQRVQAASRTTPGRYRLWSLVAAAVLVVASVVTTASATTMRSSTRRAENNSGPVLVATQQLVSSLAEADAGASAAFLSGRNEDPEQRRLYEQALARAGQQVDDIATLAGQDPSIRAVLGRISVQVTQYAGLVEAARASNKSGAADANGYLVSAVTLADQLVTGDLKALTAATQSNLGHDENHRRQGFYVAVLVLIVALAVLGFAQATLVRSSRRIVNPPLALATVLCLVALGWLVSADRTSGSALAGARAHGYDSIVLTAQLGNFGFGAKASETLALITGEQVYRVTADGNAQAVATSPITDAVADLMRRGQAGGAPGGLLGQAAVAADNARERAAVAEAGVRWQRYETTVATQRAAPNQAAATAIAVGQANSDFNGFNFAVESILGQNRGQFLDGLATAAHRTSRVPTGVLLLLLASLGAAFWGFQLRINDYR